MKDKKKSSWITHCKAVYEKERKKNPKFMYKDALKMASKSYNK